MKNICFSLCAVISMLGYAQAPETTVQDTLELDQETLLLIEDDTTSLKDIAHFFDRVDGRYQLLDDRYAASIDSIWLTELANNQLFEDVYSNVSNLSYDEVEYTELSTEVLKERLAALNQKTPFNVEYNPSLESVIKSYLKNRRKTMQRLINLSDYYFPMFEEQLDKYDLPFEIKYLSIVESALNPKAKSRVGATGLWQFMFQTGKMYGLNVNSYVDERSDPIASTDAAARYLAKLYKIFGDWDLALAAYNSGPGNVTKAIRRSGGYQNYWNIRPFLPRETAGYVPAFLATMYIFEYAEEHGFTHERHDSPYFQTDTVSVKQLLSFDQISELIDVDVEELQFFNPSYKLDVIPYLKDKPYKLRLPISYMGKFVANEDSIYAYAKAEFDKKEKVLPQFFQQESKITHRVRSGDVLGKIAQRYKVRVSEIKRWNGLRNNNIRIGQRLTIYPRGTAHIEKKKSTASVTKSAKKSSATKVHVVKEGDTLWGIAKKYPGISVEKIKLWNDISGDKLTLGAELKLCDC